MIRVWTQYFRAWTAKAASALRHHYMLGVTAVVLGFAAAGGLGYFDEPAEERPSRTVPGSPDASPVVVVPATPRTPVPTRPFEFNVFLVSTREHQMALQQAENLYRSPYLVGSRASEVLLVTTAEEDLQAAHHIEEVRMSFPGANVVITDLR